jgi:hypothetical protein
MNKRTRSRLEMAARALEFSQAHLVPATTCRFGPSEFCAEPTDGLRLRCLALAADDHASKTGKGTSCWTPSPPPPSASPSARCLR